MKALTVSLAGLGLAALATDMASAASPAYCALYAREYANQMVQEGAPAGMTVSVQDQAYYRCLNQDEGPALPAASAYFGTDIGGPEDSVATISQGDASEGDEVPVSADSGPKPKAVAAAASSSTTRRGNLPNWSPEWVAKCKKYYPNSFDPKTGTVLPYHASSRRMCPY
jgi:hypothetical protein